MSASRQGSSSQRRILLGLALGAAAGVAANLAADRDPGAQRWVLLFTQGVAHPTGRVFLRLLFLVVLPLVLASLAAGVASRGDLGKLGRLGVRTSLLPGDLRRLVLLARQRPLEFLRGPCRWW